MSIFDLRNLIIEEYGKYVQSFFSIADVRVREFIKEEILINRALWPDALLQINPLYEMAVRVEDLVSGGKLHPICSEIFRIGGEESLRLFRHQQEAIEKALNRKHFVVTSGTGSGKTLTYFIPIFDSVLRNNPQDHKVRAIEASPNGLTVTEIAQREETGIRTICQDLEALQAASFPLYNERAYRVNRWAFIDTFKFKIPPSFPIAKPFLEIP